MRHMDPPTDYDLYSGDQDEMYAMEYENGADISLDISGYLDLVITNPTTIYVSGRAKVSRVMGTVEISELDLRRVFIAFGDRYDLWPIDLYALEKLKKIEYAELMAKIEQMAIRLAEESSPEKWTLRE